ncbi:hypothetical protein DFH28DRAFT_933448 [Melampsora americana]|nr:hypothetical protein DFH28DRAFT_933448 [Melampsora americana]
MERSSKIQDIMLFFGHAFMKQQQVGAWYPGWRRAPDEEYSGCGESVQKFSQAFANERAFSKAWSGFKWLNHILEGVSAVGEKPEDLCVLWCVLANVSNSQFEAYELSLLQGDFFVIPHSEPKCCEKGVVPLATCVEMWIEKQSFAAMKTPSHLMMGWGLRVESPSMMVGGLSGSFLTERLLKGHKSLGKDGDESKQYFDDVWKTVMADTKGLTNMKEQP